MKVEKYITRGIQDKVPCEIQMLLWTLQSKVRRESKEIDYLQVYELSIKQGQQKIVHRSEEPEYRADYVIEVDNPVRAKIFVIEDNYGDKLIETMLLAEEY